MFSDFFIVFLISSTKFALSPFFAVLEYKMSYWQTVGVTSAGGCSGVIVYAFLTKPLFIAWNFFVTKTQLNRLFSNIKSRLVKRKANVPRKIFTKKNHRIIYIRRNYGLIGIALLTPILLSIPIGTIVAMRYYPDYKKTIAFLIVAVFLWSNILTLALTRLP